MQLSRKAQRHIRAFFTFIIIIILDVLQNVGADLMFILPNPKINLSWAIWFEMIQNTYHEQLTLLITVKLHSWKTDTITVTAILHKPYVVWTFIQGFVKMSCIHMSSA